MSKVHREASKRLALALQARYRALVEANGQDEIQTAAIALGDLFNTNIEFIINVLRDYGGLEARFEPLTRTGPQPPRPELPKMPALLAAGADVDLPKRN